MLAGFLITIWLISSEVNPPVFSIGIKNFVQRINETFCRSFRCTVTAIRLKLDLSS
jgi:hypothetical protein